MPSPIQIWNDPPRELRLTDNDVHVWRALLDQCPTSVQQLLVTLSEDERMRADQYRFQRDREHFVVARGALREILSRYLDMEPSRLRFQYTTYGKPHLAEQSLVGDLRFNLSHSNGLAIFGFTQGRNIGADIERIREGKARERIAERFFSPQEVRVLRQLPEELQDEGFFNCWIRKEAFIKAKGEGLSIPLNEFVVSLAPGKPALLLSVKGVRAEASNWTYHQLSPGSRYVAVLGVEASGLQLQCWHWEHSSPTR